MTWLLAWLWQGTLLVAVIEMLLWPQRRLGASTRYWIWGVALLVIAGWAGWPLVFLLATRRDLLLAGGDAVPLGVPVPDVFLRITLPILPSWLFALIAGIWITVAVGRLIGVLRACTFVWRVKRCAMPVLPTDARQLRGWTRCGAQGRQALLCVSDMVTMPSALGLGRGVIVLPRCLVLDLEADELDQVVLHELAHLRRRDDWTRLLQALVEAIVGLHPAVWWIGRRLDLEREAACDAFAVRHTESSLAYATCLTKVARFAVAVDPAGAVAPGAGRTGYALRARITRLLDASSRTGWSAGASMAAGALTLAGAAASAAIAASLVAFVEVSPAVLSAAGGGSAQRAMRQASDGSFEPIRRAASREAEAMAPAQPRLTGSRWLIRSTPINISSATHAPRVDPALNHWFIAPSLVSSAGSSLQATASVANGTATVGLIASMRVSVPVSQAVFRPHDDRSVWLDVADAGTAVGLGMKDAGTATAGFFVKFGRSMVDAF